MWVLTGGIVSIYYLFTMRPGPRFNIKISYHLILLVWATPMLKERRLVRRLSVNMGLPILVRRYLYIETGPWYFFYLGCYSS